MLANKIFADEARKEKVLVMVPERRLKILHQEELIFLNISSLHGKSDHFKTIMTKNKTETGAPNLNANFV